MNFYQVNDQDTILTSVYPWNGTEADYDGLTLLRSGERGAPEKHIPVVHVRGDVAEVQVGAQEHPMLAEHYIQFIVLETNQGAQIQPLSPGQQPRARFFLRPGEQVVAAHEHCNLHGLWSTY